jgi:hypothetical protein
MMSRTLLAFGGGLAAAFAFAQNPAAAEPRETLDAQVGTFLDRLLAGDLRGASAALPSGVRLGDRRGPMSLSVMRAVISGCPRREIFVTAFSWLAPPPRRQRPPAGPPSRLRPTAMIFVPGAPPPGAEEIALTVPWDCPESRGVVLTYFYLVGDRIVRVALARPPMRAP